MIQKERLKDLQQIIKEEWGQDLPLSEVEAIGRTLIDYFKLLATIAERKAWQDQDRN